MSSASSDPPSPRIWTIDDGDAAARDGRWSDAVTIWAGLRTGGTTSPAEERLRWFLGRTGTMAPVPSTATRSPWPPILGATGLGFLGTAIVLVGEGVGGNAAVLTSVAAWTCYLAAGVLILLYAHARHVAERDRSRLNATDIAMALETAKHLDQDLAGHDHHHS